MDEDFYKLWFEGFSKGLETLDQENRSKLLAPCAKRCADSGVLAMYKEHFQKVNGDRDAFYARISEIGGARGEIVVPGKEYYIYFPDCYCDLHCTGGVNTPSLCECSLQSIKYVGKNIWGDIPCRVEQISTILSGDSECKFKITFL